MPEPVLLAAPNPTVASLPAFPKLRSRAKDVREGIPSFYTQLDKLFAQEETGGEAQVRETLAQIHATPYTQRRKLSLLFGKLDSSDALGYVQYDTICRMFPDPLERAMLQYGNHWSKSRDWEAGRENELPSWVAHKIGLSAWHAQFTRLPWNHIVRVVDALRGLVVVNDNGTPLPDFTWHFDTTTSYNPKGHSRFHRRFLDAELALFLYFQGEPIAVVSFHVLGAHTLESKGNKLPVIAIHQVQLLNAKGNRCLFKLGPRYFESILHQLYVQLQLPVLLIKGSAAVDAVLKSYANSLKKQEFLAEAPRLQQLYDQPLSRLTRVKDIRSYAQLQLN
jgi:hypothetical protein